MAPQRLPRLQACACCVALLLAALQQAHAFSFPAAKSMRDQLASVSAAFNGHAVGSAAAELLWGWNYTLPASALRKGLGYVGSNHRLRRALRDALDGKPTKIGFLGGSITHGSDASAVGLTDWVSLLASWGQAALPTAKFRNGAVSATPSSYMAMCMEHSLDQDVDIVFIEYLVNDGSDDRVVNSRQTKGYEKLMRRVLALPKAPAVIMLQTWGQAQTHNNPATHTEFHHSHESAYSALAQYYDAQYLSFMAATNRLHQLKVPGYDYSDFMASGPSLFTGTHPIDLGHKLIADLAVWLVQQTVLDLVLRPWGQADADQIHEHLPPPMIPGNEVPSSVMCLQGPSIQKVVTSSEGWQFVNEGTDKKPKTGYVSTTPGSTLRLTVDTVRPGQTGSVTVSLGYLRSYEHMGKAAVRCEGSCTCEPKQLDGSHSTPTSQVYMAAFQASQHPQCVVAVTVLPATSSGEHKFKVASLTISESVDPIKGPWFKDGGPFDDLSVYEGLRKDMRAQALEHGR